MFNKQLAVFAVISVALNPLDAEAAGLKKGARSKLNFIRHMREAEKKFGKISNQMPKLDKFIKEGMKKSDFEATTEATTKRSPDDRQLYYAEEEVEAAEDEEAAQEDQNSGKWWSWGSSWGSSGNNGEMTEEEMAAYNETASMYDGDNTTQYNMNGLNDMSMKYAGCQSLTSFVGVDEDSDEDATGFISTALVSYRFCPAESCEDESWQGCNSVYGEYMMPVQSFLEAQQDYVDATHEAFCDYCSECVYFEKYFCNSEECCEFHDTCNDEEYGYEQSCEGNAYEEESYDFDEVFECQEVDISDDFYSNNGQYYQNNEDDGNRYVRRANYVSGNQNEFYSWYNGEMEEMSEAQSYGYGNGGDDGDQQKPSVYMGVTCNGANIEMGLFKDSLCTQLIATDENDFISTATGVDVPNMIEIEETYIPPGCMSCNGADYNIRSSDWYVPQNEQEEQEYEDEDEEEYVSEICYNIYHQSAKCDSNLEEETVEELGESDEEMEGEELACGFIKAAVMGQKDEMGFVYESTASGNPLSTFVEFFTGEATPQYVYRNHTMVTNNHSVTGGQVAALTLSMLGTGIAAAAVLYLKKEIDGSSSGKGLMFNEAAASSLPGVADPKDGIMENRSMD